ncbi:MAG: extracellular solute-binding protein [Actinomycetota bacterium]
MRGARIAACLLLGAVLLPACSSNSAKTSITLYNGQHVQTTDALVSGFEKATGINVVVRSNDEDTLADQVISEGSHSPADVIYTENSLVLEHLQEQGLLAPVEVSTLAAVPSTDSSPQGDWVGISARVSVMIYNPSLIAEGALPTTVLDAASPKYSGKIAIAPSESDFQPIVTAVEAKDGQAATVSWLEGLKSNAGSHVYPDNETVADEVNRGVVAFGIVNQYYWYRMQAEIGASAMHSQIAYFGAGDPGYVIDVSGAAVIKASKHAAAAQKFLAYLVSQTGQRVIAHSISYEYPLLAGVATTAPETPLGQLQPDPITLSQLGDGSEAVTLLRQAGLL